MSVKKSNLLNVNIVFLVIFISRCYANDILGCGGFVKSHASLDFSKIEIGLYTKEGSLKEKTECAPTNGYYFLPLYEEGEYILKVHPPAGWSFEPSQVELIIDGETDQCSSGQDINFSFNGFGITGRVVTAGQKQGPSGINIQLVNEIGDVRNTVTTTGGDFHFTPVIPGKYVVKASHSKWKIEPSQTIVQVKEGNTALPIGSLTVKGYDVSGSVISFGSPISGIYVLLYSKNENQKLRVEGCKTALLQGGVPDAPICYTVTDAAGEFQFGLVPAGEYKLLAMNKSPGQGFVTYNIKPDVVPFAVLHDSLYIKNAFEVTGFDVRGRALQAPGGAGAAGARVLRGGRAVATCDADGSFTLTGLKPATYTLTFQHEECEWDELPLVVTSGGPVAALVAAAARWSVCGQLTPPEPRTLLLRPDLRVQAGADGKWCAFLPSGEYTIKVEVSEQEQRDGLQFYPERQTVRVRGAALDGVSFGQVRARVRGRVHCGAHCGALHVTLRALGADGGDAGPARRARVADGEYSFEDVVPGGVELSVEEAQLCWEQAAHVVAVTQRQHTAPPFSLRGLALLVSASHALQLHYEAADGSASGELAVPAGDSRQCLPPAERYTLTPRGCHRVQPASAQVQLGGAEVPSVRFVATAHAAVVEIISPEPATDVVLRITMEGQSPEEVPLEPIPRDGVYVYEHTMYLEEGAAAEVSAQSAALLFRPRARRVRGGAACARVAALRAVRARLLAGRLQPPVAGVLLTLEGGDVKLTQTTEADGKYSFGPLDADTQYTVHAEKDSYAFDEPDENGIIVAHKLAEIAVVLRDQADHAPLEGALVSVSGGSFRRNVASGAEGSLRFASLAPAQYYVKPHMKEYRFEPPHALVAVDDGREHRVVFEGIRVAWSLMGRVVTLGGAGAARASLRARPASPNARPHCAQQDATASNTGHFRIRGLLPDCVYVVELKESAEPELAGIVLAKQPPPFEMKEKDIENVRLIVIQTNHLTDTNVLIRTPNIDHYKTLRLTLALESTPHNPIYSTKLDPLGYNQFNNPGLMYVMPRLPADNKTYVLQIESTLSKVSHSYEESVFYFNSDGNFRSFDIDFEPKLRSSEQELRHSPLALLALLALCVLYSQRARLAGLRAVAARRERRT